jgi:hypothetical protein
MIAIIEDWPRMSMRSAADRPAGSLREGERNRMAHCTATRDRRGQPVVAVAVLVAMLSSAFGCAPTLDIAGTYFPPAVVSAVTGLTVGYLVSRLLAKNPKTRPLAQSALFFAGVSVIAGCSAWWSLFGIG